MNTNIYNNRCFYGDKICDFLRKSKDAILGCISRASHGSDSTQTKEAWDDEINIMLRVLQPWKDEEDAYIFFEYNIPRLGKRIDVVILLRGMVFCLEFKVGQRDALQSNVEQVLDYALDLKNFHKFSEDRPIVPILVPTRYNNTSIEIKPSAYNDGIYNPLIVGEEQLQTAIYTVIQDGSKDIDPEKWGKNWPISPYIPTPTIIEAARALYENHSVEDITRHEADKVSTDATIKYVMDVIKRSKQNKEKSICFVTGVPGAGKTLVGLDVAVKQSYKDGEIDKENGAVFLSGNGPLVAVLTEALAIDNRKKCVANGEKKNLSDSRREVGEFLQIIHRYRDNMLAKIKNPVENGKLEIDPTKAIAHGETGYGEVEHVAIFDEAQRSWTHKRLADYLKRGGTYGNKLKVPNFPVSEASFLIWSLDQRKDWAVIVCLVGGGQEINTGEAGIGEWIKALNEEYTHWKIHISNKLTTHEYAEGKVNELLKDNRNVTFSEQLHLAVNQRALRAEKLSDFVNSLLSFDSNTQTIYNALYDNVTQKGYPFVLTRDINKARVWLR